MKLRNKPNITTWTDNNRTYYDIANSFFIKNEGTTTATIGRHLTLAPGASVSVGSGFPDIDTELEWLIEFSGAGTNKLVIIKNHIVDCS